MDLPPFLSTPPTRQTIAVIAFQAESINSEAGLLKAELLDVKVPARALGKWLVACFDAALGPPPLSVPLHPTVYNALQLAVNVFRRLSKPGGWSGMKIEDMKSPEVSDEMPILATALITVLAQNLTSIDLTDRAALGLTAEILVLTYRLLRFPLDDFLVQSKEWSSFPAVVRLHAAVEGTLSESTVRALLRLPLPQASAAPAKPPPKKGKNPGANQKEPSPVAPAPPERLLIGIDSYLELCRTPVDTQGEILLRRQVEGNGRFLQVTNGRRGVATFLLERFGASLQAKLTPSALAGTVSVSTLPFIRKLSEQSPNAPLPSTAFGPADWLECFVALIKEDPVTPSNTVLIPNLVAFYRLLSWLVDSAPLSLLHHQLGAITLRLIAMIQRHATSSHWKLSLEWALRLLEPLAKERARRPYPIAQRLTFDAELVTVLSELWTPRKGPAGTKNAKGGKGVSAAATTITDETSDTAAKNGLRLCNALFRSSFLPSDTTNQDFWNRMTVAVINFGKGPRQVPAQCLLEAMRFVTLAWMNGVGISKGSWIGAGSGLFLQSMLSDYSLLCPYLRTALTALAQRQVEGLDQPDCVAQLEPLYLQLAGILASGKVSGEMSYFNVDAFKSFELLQRIVPFSRAVKLKAALVLREWSCFSEAKFDSFGEDTRAAAKALRNEVKELLEATEQEQSEKLAAKERMEVQRRQQEMELVEATRKKMEAENRLRVERAERNEAFLLASVARAKQLEDHRQQKLLAECQAIEQRAKALIASRQEELDRSLSTQNQRQVLAATRRRAGEENLRSIRNFLLSLALPIGKIDRLLQEIRKRCPSADDLMKVSQQAALELFVAGTLEEPTDLSPAGAGAGASDTALAEAANSSAVDAQTQNETVLLDDFQFWTDISTSVTTEFADEVGPEQIDADIEEEGASACHHSLHRRLSFLLNQFNFTDPTASIRHEWLVQSPELAIEAVQERWTDVAHALFVAESKGLLEVVHGNRKTNQGSEVRLTPMGWLYHTNYADDSKRVSFEQQYSGTPSAMDAAGPEGNEPSPLEEDSAPPTQSIAFLDELC